MQNSEISEPVPVATRRRARCQITLALLAVAAVLAAPSANARETAPKVRTLATVNGVILAFDQDGSRLASLERPRKECERTIERTTLVVRTVGGRRPARIRLGLCAAPRLFQFGGERAAWSKEYADKNAIDHDELWTVALGNRRVRRVETLGLDTDVGGRSLTDIAADGPTSVYGALWWSLFPEGDSDCWNLPDCHLEVSGGRVIRTGSRSTVIPDAAPPAKLAVGGGRMAIAPPVMAGCACNIEPRWSPDGGAIAYTQRDGPDTEVVIASPGGPPTKVTDNWTFEYTPDWSPDGARLVYMSGYETVRAGRTGVRYEIVISDRTGAGVRRIAAGYGPSWSPDGGRIVFTKPSRDGLWLVSSDGSGERRLTERPDFEPEWSPDGRQLAITRRRGDGEQEIVVMGADATGARALGVGFSPTWSPDGQSIAYTRDDGKDWELRVIGVDGTGDRALTDNAVADYYPDWSPDGTRIVFARGTGLESELYTVSAAGGSEARLTTTRPERFRSPVEIRTAAGRLVSRFLPTADPERMALSGAVAATLSRPKRAALLELFDPRSGRKLGAASLPRNSRWLSVAGRTVVFSSGRRIWALDARTKKRRLVATAAASPVGLSIEGRRIAWAENLKTTARIRVLLVP